MNFSDLYKKIAEIDGKLVTESTDASVEECGMPMPAPQEPKPSMSVNLNAQGMNNIEDLFKLMTRVNPDMMPKQAEPMPTISMEPMMGPKPLNKLLPDMDADNDDKVGGEKDIMKMDDMDSDYDGDGKLDKHEKDHDDEAKLHATVDRDGDGDHDMDDHEMEKEGFQDATTEPDEEYKDIEYLTKKLAGGMNGPKGTYPKVADGDNPMQQVEGDRYKDDPEDIDDLMKGIYDDDEEGDDADMADLKDRIRKHGSIGMGDFGGDDDFDFESVRESEDALRKSIHEDLTKRLAELKSK